MKNYEKTPIYLPYPNTLHYATNNMKKLFILYKQKLKNDYK